VRPHAYFLNHQIGAMVLALIMDNISKPVRQPGESLNEFAKRVIKWQDEQTEIARKLRIKAIDEISDLQTDAKIALIRQQNTRLENDILSKAKNRKKLYIIGTVLLLLIITNPSLKSFKEHLGQTTDNGLSRNYNLLVFSIYDDSYNKYLGIFENFIKIGSIPQQTTVTIDQPTQQQIDSATMADSSKMVADTNRNN
jgi:hypothetical protein